ncbi:hypothetical protein BJ994_000259 [Arthrobacter pigmenti]|uniref:Uncharacterized protein n=1 Tax=Arthrobacter pigmenti TaxID=271432 RepID=A0A846RDU4_9MICC|nr:hypothetical protein [Arthrobacter pigmenti]
MCVASVWSKSLKSDLGWTLQSDTTGPTMGNAHMPVANLAHLSPRRIRGTCPL